MTNRLVKLHNGEKVRVTAVPLLDSVKLTAIGTTCTLAISLTRKQWAHVCELVDAGFDQISDWKKRHKEIDN